MLELRKALKLNQEEFGKALGVSQRHISQIENNARNPSEQLLKHICLRFFVNENWLLTGQGEMFTPPDEAVKDLLKTLTARHGERAVVNALHNIMKEHGLAVAAGRPAARADTGDPELDRMIDTLYLLWSGADERLKNWISVQFDIAYPKSVIAEAEKKQKESQQLSAG